jgi:hypothetical protein
VLYKASVGHGTLVRRGMGRLLEASGSGLRIMFFLVSWKLYYEQTPAQETSIVPSHPLG